MPEHVKTASKLLWRVFAILSAVLLIVVVILVSRLYAQHAELAAQTIRAALAEQETRSLRQQLEAERILAAAQARLLQNQAAAGPAVPPAPLSADRTP